MEEKIVIHGGKPLIGEVTISGNKNSAVAIVPAALLADGPCVIENLPDINDIRVMQDMLLALGAQVEFSDNTMRIDPRGVHSYQPPVELARKMRASYYLMGVLLARFGKAEVAFPGGCDIGARPIDQHIKGLRALGCEITTARGSYLCSAASLQGREIYLDMPSVGATENLMMAACLAEGVTRIENAAKEPEIIDLACCLNQMGAHITGAGASTIVIQGVKALHGVRYTPIPDRIEAGTMACAAAMTGGDLILEGARADHLRSLLFKLAETGVRVEELPNGLRVAGRAKEPMEIRTMVYPGFPTDLQAPMMALTCVTPGTSVFLETIFENRYMHAVELTRMGAHIRVENRVAIVDGGARLTGARVKATDLRAGAALILAGLCAQGETVVDDPGGHIDRGYEHIEEKLRAVGGNVTREE